MGILSRKLGDRFVITSDRDADGNTSRRAPARLSDDYQVWTGTRWSISPGDAQQFATLDEADEYVRANYVRVMA